MVKLAIIAGTRPEVIKLFPIYKILEKEKQFKCYWISIEQQKKLLTKALKEFQIKPDLSIKIKKQKSLNLLYAEILRKINPLWSLELSGVIVQGDTATTFSAALSAFLKQIPIFFIEAGLRSFDLMSPFPEEGNRQMISRIASINFTPTLYEKKYLIQEKIDSKKIFVTGNTIVDSLSFALKNQLSITSSFKKIINQLLLNKKKIILFTMHRRENISLYGQQIIDEILLLIKNNPETMLVYLGHPNKMLEITKKLLTLKNQIIFFKNALNYMDTTFLIQKAECIISDSGGIFEEAILLGKPIICLRNKSERFAQKFYSSAVLLGDDPKKLQSLYASILKNKDKIHKKAYFGHGQPSQKIAKLLCKFFQNSRVE